VALTTTSLGNGRLQVTAAPTSYEGFPANAVKAIRFAAGTRAEVEIPGQPTRSTAFTWTLPANTTQATFTVHRTAAGPVQLPFTVVDNCGDWTTFVGGGASAF